MSQFLGVGNFSHYVADTGYEHIEIGNNVLQINWSFFVDCLTKDS